MERSERVSMAAIAVNLILFGLKYTFAALSGSIALKAEAFHSLSDVVASFTVFAGLIISQRKTKSFPYGLYKVENLVSVIVAFAIFYAAYEILLEATKARVVELQNVGFTIASVICSILITYALSRYQAKVGKAINSPSLIANAEHIRIDMFANAAVLVALFSNFIDADLDRITAFIIVAIIAWAGGKILIDGIRVLLDASLDYNTLSLAEKLILAEPQVFEIQNLMGRNSGRYKFIEANIILKTHDLEKAYFIANRIEENIRKQIKNVDRVLIYYEPTQKENLIYAAPLKDIKKQLISDHFGEAPFFVLVTVNIKTQKTIEQKIIENPYTQVKSGKGILVAEFLNKNSIDFIITRKTFDGKGPFYVFANSAVENLITEEESLRKALESFGISLNPGRIKIGKNLHTF